MTAAAGSYARLLLEQVLSPAALEEVRALAADPALRDALENPAYDPREKEAVIRRLFPAEARRFFSVLCREGDWDLLPEILERHDALVRERDGVALVIFTCCHPPTESQRARIEALVREKYGKNGVEWHTVLDPEILGGFILSVDDRVLDRSLRTLADDLRRHITRGKAL